MAVNKWQIVWLLSSVIAILSGCSQDNATQTEPTGSDRSGLPVVAVANRQVTVAGSLQNEEAPIPPQCYTKTEGNHNPCYVCHQKYTHDDTSYRMNKLNDGGIQGEYLFSDIGVSNHWKNLFVDRRDWVSGISDETIKTYINQDNYSELPTRLRTQSWQGFIPDLSDYASAANAFDQEGFAKDGSHWVAFSYKPMPSTFWPTNGATDDVLVRLPATYRTLNGEYIRHIYQLNLALAELNMKQLSSISISPVDEVALQVDVNGDQVLTGKVTRLVSQKYYFGDAGADEVIPQQMPLGTEFMHSVRYVGADEEGNIVVPPRMKELRYMQKIKVLSDSELASRYDRERKEKLQEELPGFVDHGDQGFNNGLGWMIQGFIEAYDGQLRPQSYEEGMFCMGCHSSIGSTIDSTFAFGRKVTGVKGWGYINLKGMPDAPSISQEKGEILQYLQRSGGGHEFRENQEMTARWFNADGSVKADEVKHADVYTLITPSVERAMALNKAYTQIVRYQSYQYGRDATILPAQNVYKEIDESVPPLEPDAQLYGWDIRLNWLDE